MGDNGPLESCCVLGNASVAVSTSDLRLAELAGELGPEPQLLEALAPTCTLFEWLDGSFTEPGRGTRGWWKRIGGSWDWWAKAIASGVVAAAAWSGA